MAMNRKEHVRHSRPVLKSRQWQVLRHQILERDGWKCRACGARHRLEVDHVQSVRNAPERAFDPRNLQVLCGACHTKKTRIECGHKPLDPKRAEWRGLLRDMQRNPVEPERKTNA